MSKKALIYKNSSFFVFPKNLNSSVLYFDTIGRFFTSSEKILASNPHGMINIQLKKYGDELTKKNKDALIVLFKNGIFKNYTTYDPLFRSEYDGIYNQVFASLLKTLIVSEKPDDISKILIPESLESEVDSLLKHKNVQFEKFGLKSLVPDIIDGDIQYSLPQHVAQQIKVSIENKIIDYHTPQDYEPLVYDEFDNDSNNSHGECEKIASILLDTILPVPDDDVDLMKIIEFREKYKDERIVFYLKLISSN